MPEPDAPPAPSRLVLLGHPVGHSLSATFQNAALGAAGIHARYEALDVAPAELERAIDELKRARAGGNVTVPHKAAVARACDTLTDVAVEVGAVNTFWCAADGALVGDNTDVAGVEATLRALSEFHAGAAPARIALIGAGGAAAAVVAAAARVVPDARVAVCSRRGDAAAALAARFPANAVASVTVGDALDGAAVVVNATPLGLRPGDPLPCSVADLPDSGAVFDLVYGPRETAWVRASRAAGHVACDGLLMLVEQGAAAFERWFGRAPDRAEMWRAVRTRTDRPVTGWATA
ncbi:shikimate dehydrogenase [Gemmatimonadetes bacterium T265]|nr:shikimate dehydrogenase [Gemmatimonadetes bacterium T265]